MAAPASVTTANTGMPNDVPDLCSRWASSSASRTRRRDFSSRLLKWPSSCFLRLSMACARLRAWPWFSSMKPMTASGPSATTSRSPCSLTRIARSGMPIHTLHASRSSITACSGCSVLWMSLALTQRKGSVPMSRLPVR